MDTYIVWAPSEGRQTARQKNPGGSSGVRGSPESIGAKRTSLPIAGKGPQRDSPRRERGLWEMAAQTFRHEPPSVYALSSWQQTSGGSRKASPPDLESMPILLTSARVGLPTSAQTSIKCYCDPALSLSWASAHLVENSCGVMRGWPSLS
jgi:hypothetical protein